MGYDIEPGDTTKPKVGSLLRIGTEIEVTSERRGTIIGYTTCKRMSEADEPDTYYVVELDRRSAGYLDGPTNEHGGTALLSRDCFVSMILVHPSNV